MKSRLGLIALLLLGLAVLAGCATLEALMGGEPADAPHDAQDVVEAPAAPAFTFYDSYAKW